MYEKVYTLKNKFIFILNLNLLCDILPYVKAYAFIKNKKERML